jgi:hypothetical protein
MSTLIDADTGLFTLNTATKFQRWRLNRSISFKRKREAQILASRNTSWLFDVGLT